MSGFNIYLVWAKLCVIGVFLSIVLYVFHDAVIDFNKKNVNVNDKNVSYKVIQSIEPRAKKPFKNMRSNSRMKQTKQNARNDNLRQFKKAVFSHCFNNTRVI